MIVTRLLGQSHLRVGRAILEAARCAIRAGDPGRARSLCEDTATDFRRLVDRLESDPGGPDDEVRISLGNLRAALDLLAEIRDSSFGPEQERLRSRCVAQLARP